MRGEPNELKKPRTVRDLVGHFMCGAYFGICFCICIETFLYLGLVLFNRHFAMRELGVYKWGAGGEGGGFVESKFGQQVHRKD